MLSAFIAPRLERRSVMNRTFPLGAVLLTAFAPLVGKSSGADVKRYTIEKGVQYVQADAGAPVADSNNGVIFEADVKASDTNLVSSASLLVPNGTSAALPLDSPDEFKLKKKFDKQTGLEKSFPDGSYQLTLNTAAHDGTKSLPLSLTGDLYPNTPHLANFAAAQALDAGAYFLFAWEAFAGGTSDDFVQLHIEDNQGNKVFETPDVGEKGALDGRATAALVPPRTFSASQGYQAFLYFTKAVTRDTTTYPGAFGFSGYYKRTKMAIQTAGVESQAEVKLYGVTKTRRFQQNDTGAPAVQPTKTFNFEAFADAGTPGVVSSVSLVLPGGAVQAVPLASDNKSFDLVQDFTSQSEIDAAFPNGTYTFKIAAPSGAKTPALALTSDAYPAAPHLTALPVQINAARDLTVSWDPFSGGSSTDFVQLHSDDDQGNKVWETPDLGKSGALDGTAQSATIPHDTFLPGHAYNGRLVFQRNVVLNTTSYPGALGLASYISRTGFQLTVAGSDGQTQPTLAVLSAPGSATFSFAVQGTPSQKVRIEGSSDLLQWADLGTNTLSATGQFTYNEPQLSSFSRRYYRVVVVP